MTNLEQVAIALLTTYTCLYMFPSSLYTVLYKIKDRLSAHTPMYQCVCVNSDPVPVWYSGCV